ncbi:MAG: multifunctional CCA addition/repair protein [Gammaproteobacteria bacterium]|nr:multifunctional CCA addition/repair protein [Gammaproteobacteria bacterium]MBU1600857.1 multifunctional CCA addition/repair protein [Gammaproteobacteria bacterium]MBU2435313.1 multifunctional CCA addition/repair protein [Gammaproteobacteria bacterium]MBU2448727.1 multifunctional CCA addition/repair protein [Gammaproteobacteria bacterium]
MQIFIVGGAVRDELLGRPNADRDYVVVGATPEALLKQGFRPVGKDFPVFLHPQTQEEYALARTERKSGHGYHGFTFHAAPDVTLEEDLARRDLTINAMAKAADGALIDPFHGQLDLSAKILRHVGPAFAEDPVRILRIARFAARFSDFTVAPETLTLMRDMVASGEVDHLVAERVWQELATGLMEDRPSRMFEVLRDCGALARLLPELDVLFGVAQRADYHPEIDTGIHTMMVVDQSAKRGFALPVRFAALTHDLGKGTTPADILPRHIGHEERSVHLSEKLCARLRVPGDCRDLALLMARYHGNVHRAADLKASTIVTLFEKTDALRRPERFQQLLDACLCDYTGRLGWENRPYDSPRYLLQALATVNAVDAGKIALACPDKAKIPERIHAARVNALRKWLNEPGEQPEQQ